MKKVKSMLFKAEIEGQGIVNSDSEHQKFIWNQLEGKEHCIDNNVSFAKKNWYLKDGKLTYKVKISSSCLRHAMFEDDFQYQSPNLINITPLLIASLATPASIVRGYLYAEKGSETIKKTSCISLNDAEQTCDAVSNLETFSRSGKKVKDENKSDNTFFKKETVGKINYELTGAMNFKEMQIFSLDQIFDRLAINPDTFELFKRLLKTRMPNFNSEPKYHQIKGSAVQIPEYSFLFSSEDILFLTKFALEKILAIEIRKAQSFAKLKNIKIKLIYNCDKDKAGDEEGWISLNSIKDIQNLNFEVENFFIEEDTETAKALREEIEKMEEAKKQRNKEEAQMKKKEKDAQKKKKEEDDALIKANLENNVNNPE